MHMRHGMKMLLYVLLWILSMDLLSKPLVHALGIMNHVLRVRN